MLCYDAVQEPSAMSECWSGEWKERVSLISENELIHKSAEKQKMIKRIQFNKPDSREQTLMCR